MARILNQAQAEAIYSAMCALNNVGGHLACELIDGTVVIEKSPLNPQVIQVSSNGRGDEFYESQAAFATAYGLER